MDFDHRALQQRDMVLLGKTTNRWAVVLYDRYDVRITPSPVELIL